MIVVIQGILPHYRRAVMNELCRLGRVIVIHSGAPGRREGDRFEETILPTRKSGPFHIQSGLAETIERLKPDVVIAMFDMRWLATLRAMYRFDRKLNWVWWGLDRGYSRMATQLKTVIAQRRNPIVFYDRVARDYFSGVLSGRDRLFVANNTFHVPDRVESYLHPEKNRFINVGTFDARKQNDVTIRVLAKIWKESGRDIRFTLIGDGAERDRLAALAAELGMTDRVELIGRINDPARLARYYTEALASVSFGQAGLAVLQSMAFGVPFVTKRNAVSGGEINNIIDQENGLLCEDDPASLEVALRSLIEAPDRARTLGREAYRYYSEKATIENMVDNFELAIEWGRRASG